MKMLKNSKIIFVLGLAVVLAAAAGCGLVDNLQEYKENGDTGNIPEPDGQVIEQQVDITDDEAEKNKDVGQADTASGTDNDAANDADKDDTAASPTVGENEVEVVLYFMSSDGSSLEGETRMIPKEEGLAKATINQLLSGPKSNDLMPTLPSSAKINGINISGGICTIDFSSELLEDMAEDIDDQMLALYSIVNTLTQFDTVDQVRILVEGKTVDSIGGVNASAAIAPMSL